MTTITPQASTTSALGTSEPLGSARRLGGSVLVALALTAATLIGSGVSPAAAAGGSASAAAAVVDGSSERVFTDDISTARRSQGVPMLSTRSDLVAVARRWATTMAQRDVLAHNPSLTTQVQNWRWVGENVGYGPDAQVVHVAFMNSPGHRANILDTDYTQVGVGAVMLNGRVWVAEVFRKPTKSSTSSRAVTTTSLLTNDLPAKVVTPRGVAAYSRVLVPGAKGRDVARVQRRLGVTATTRYDRATSRAVARFQRSLGWKGRGNVGHGTWNRLF